MRTAFVIAVSLLFLAQASPCFAQKPPPGTDPQLAIGTIDKISESEIVVNRLKGGPALTFTFSPRCKFRVDGLTVEKDKVKRGMKVIVEGKGKTADLILAFDKDPLPR